MPRVPEPASQPTLSVVMPAYNEEGAIADAVNEVRRVVFQAVPDAELIVVNDGSRDSTGAILDRLAAEDPRVRPVHRANGGHGPALRTALDASRGTWLFLIDSDRQIPIDSFNDLWSAAQGRDGAFGVRTGRDDPPTRLVLTRIIRAVVRAIFGTPWPDLNVPFKLLRREVWEKAAPLIPPDTLAPSLFLSIAAHRAGANITHIPVPHRRRSTGKVSIRHMKLLRFCARAFGQLWRFRTTLAP